MSTVTLRDLYAAELHDLMNAENQIVAELPMMASRATSAPLKRAFADHEAETRVQIERLQLLIEQLNDHAQLTTLAAVAALPAASSVRSKAISRMAVMSASPIPNADSTPDNG